VLVLPWQVTYLRAVLLACPRCNNPLSEVPTAKALGETAECYADCRRVCATCDIGLSNSADHPTFIRGDWRDGLWRRGTASRLERMIRTSLNQRSRETKRRRLAHERSEDLLTWNVFSWLEDRGLLADVARFLGLDAPDGAVKIVYWGADHSDVLGLDLAQFLVDTFGERRGSLSEPDVMLVAPAALAMIEVKLDSPNEPQPGKAVDRYVNAVPGSFRPVAEVQSAAYYELTRNWAIGAALAQKLSRRFALVNLVREGQEVDIEERFGRVVLPKKGFKRATWETLIRAVEPALVAHLEDETLCFEPAFPTLKHIP
jgi:hypothetical protein